MYIKNKEWFANSLGMLTDPATFVSKVSFGHHMNTLQEIGPPNEILFRVVLPKIYLIKFIL